MTFVTKSNASNVPPRFEDQLEEVAEPLRKHEIGKRQAFKTDTLCPTPAGG